MSASLRALLARHHLQLRRELGQSFLLDETLAERLATLAGVEPGDSVIEVGTGLGALTRALARSARHVLTVEIDAGVVRALRAESLLPENVELVHDDALTLDLAESAQRLGPGPVRLVANLPYSAATPLLRRLLDLRGQLSDWSVMVQRELALRLRADPGSRDYGSFSVLHALCVDVEECLELAPGCFFPAPKVRSSFLRMRPRAACPLAVGELAWLERVVRAAFAQRRKKILNCLRSGGFVGRDESARLEAALRLAGIDPAARAETVEPERLLALARALRADGCH